MLYLQPLSSLRIRDIKAHKGHVLKQPFKSKAIGSQQGHEYCLYMGVNLNLTKTKRITCLMTVNRHILVLLL